MTIEVLGIELVGYHGVLEEERRRAAVLVDVWLEPADERAAVSDAIEDAVDYRDVVAACARSRRPAPTTCSRRGAAIAETLLGVSGRRACACACASPTWSSRRRSSTLPSPSSADRSAGGHGWRQRR